jgi:hypothetical protein
MDFHRFPLPRGRSHFFCRCGRHVNGVKAHGFPLKVKGSSQHMCFKCVFGRLFDMSVKATHGRLRTLSNACFWKAVWKVVWKAAQLHVVFTWRHIVSKQLSVQYSGYSGNN